MLIFFKTLYTFMFSTRQALLFDTHIKGVVKEMGISYRGAAAILNIVLNILYCIITKIKGICEISAQSVVLK